MTDRAALGLIGGISLLLVLGVTALFLGSQPAEGPDPAVAALPALNASLNATSALLLGAGYACVRRRRLGAHRACMLTAVGVSALFLASYVTYHARAGSVPFTGQGWLRPVYFTLLLCHIVLAAAIVPLALTTLYRALSGQLERHRRVARWTLPLWLLVAVTGVLVYLILYHLDAPR